MNITRSVTLKLVKIIIIGLMVLTIFLYATWRSLNYFRGPEITVFEPLNGSSVATSTITIKGRAERINNISLNNSPMIVDEEGNFERTITIFPGVNVLTFTANDQFGRNTKLELRLFGNVSFSSSLQD